MRNECFSERNEDFSLVASKIDFQFLFISPNFLVEVVIFYFALSELFKISVFMKLFKRDIGNTISWSKISFFLKFDIFHPDFKFKDFLAASYFGARVQWRSIRNWRTASWWACSQRSPPTPFTIWSGTFKNVKKIYDHYHAEDFHKIILLVKIYWRRK